MPTTNPQQLSFDGGVNSKASPHSIADNEVVTATNIDFSSEPGAAACRFGSTKIWAVSTSAVTSISKSYKASYGNSAVYAISNAGLHRIVGGISGTATAIATSGYVVNSLPVTQFKDYTYAVATAGSLSIKDDGTNTYHWLKAAPATAPTVSSSTLAPLSLTTAFTASTNTLDGTLTAQGTGTATYTASASPYRVVISGTLLTTNMDLNGTNTIGDYGIDYTEISFSNPQKVLRVSKDYSIGDTDFTNYYHAEIDIDEAIDALPDPELLIESQLGEGTSTSVALDLETREGMLSEARTEIRAPSNMLSAAAGTYNLWAIPRTSFELVSKSNTPTGWTNIQACRIVIECASTQQVKVRKWEIQGAKNFPLNDADVGYSWAETLAEFDASNNKLDESAPGPFSARTKLQHCAAVVVGNGTATDSTYTHRILYRQGGYTRDFYAVSTNTIATTTMTDTISDIEALTLGFRMERNLMSRAEFPNNILSLSEPVFNRIFVGYQNKLLWSLPNRPGSFPKRSTTLVSHSGDEIQGLVAWPPGLVIINRDSVYEMAGTIFEGAEANWVLTRSGSKHGPQARQVCIKTPFGIPLLEADGLYMYIPGQGVDQPVPWVLDKIADAWKPGITVYKNSRVPVINQGYLLNSCAEYWDNKLYLAMPTGSSQVPNTLFVLDFATQHVWWYTYPFNITSLRFDRANSWLLAGTDDGAIMQLEASGMRDQNSGGTNTAISYSFKTKAISAPTDFVLENIAVEYKGGNGVVKAVVDNTATVTLGTLTNTNQDWLIPPFSAQVHNNIAMDFSGTALDTTGTDTTARPVFYQIEADMLVEPKRVQFWRTEHETFAPEQIWDVHYADVEVLGTGTITGVVYIDNVAVMTRTDITGPTDGRKITPLAYPNETYGHVQYTKYTSSGTVYFKHWQTKSLTRPEPPRVLNYVGNKLCQDETEWKTFEPCIAALNGTTTAIVMLDGTALSTHSMTGNYRQSYAFSVPNDSNGRSIYASYSSTTPFKFYEDRFDGLAEPDRVNNWKHGPAPLPSENYVKTWVPILNPYGTVTGTLLVDNTAISTSTFTGTDRQGYNIGVDLSAAMALQTGSIIEAYYTGTNFKHYDTQYELEAKPFGKKTWLTKYSKVGGATQLDMARWWSYDIEPVGTATITSIWDVDGTGTHTQTITCASRIWVDQIPFPPGVRFYNIQHRMLSTGNFRVWKDNVDIERQGIKGFTRTTVVGKPE